MKYLILILSFIISSCGASKNKVAVYMSPTCGCCKKWVSHLENNGFEVESIYEDNMRSIKTQYKISQKNTSCHTGVIGSYFIEGHVPLEAINKLLKERPDIDGLALPGMPIGTPGMPGDKEEPYVIYQLVDGNFSVFMTI